MKNLSRAVFVDRDGTLCRDVPYCSRPEDLELYPDAGEGVRHLLQAGYKVIIITNQSGVSRGYFTEEILSDMHKKLRRDLAAYGARIDDIYYCPHLPDEGCLCRKPSPHMIRIAATKHGVDAAESYIIGDRWMDIEMARRAGCKGALLVNPEGLSRAIPRGEEVPSFSSFRAAVLWLLDTERTNPENPTNH